MEINFVIWEINVLHKLFTSRQLPLGIAKMISPISPLPTFAWPLTSACESVRKNFSSPCLFCEWIIYTHVLLDGFKLLGPQEPLLWHSAYIGSYTITVIRFHRCFYSLISCSMLSTLIPTWWTSVLYNEKSEVYFRECTQDQQIAILLSHIEYFVT